MKSRKIKDQDVRYLTQGSGWRFDTLLEKEPDTIEWIDGFRLGETLWDIGANVGIYTIYAALRAVFKSLPLSRIAQTIFSSAWPFAGE